MGKFCDFISVKCCHGMLGQGKNLCDLFNFEIILKRKPGFYLT